MKKNGFLTFIFACIPGAGQMYYGYMQRGLSIAMMLMLCVMAATVVEPLLFLCLVIWMYSFFDTYDLIRHMAAGEPKEDSLLVLGNYEEIKKLVPQHNRLIGWGLVGFGVWALYETFVSTWLYTLLCNLVGDGYAYDIITGIPNVVIAALLIFAGLKLLGLHPETKHGDDELLIRGRCVCPYAAGRVCPAPTVQRRINEVIESWTKKPPRKKHAAWGRWRLHWC